MTAQGRGEAKFWRKLIPGALLTFISTYSLHNRLVSLLKLEEIVKPQAEQLHAHNCSFFEFLIKENKSPFFYLWLVIAIRSAAFRLG